MDMTELFTGLMDAKETPIVICDLNYRILYMNKKAKEIYADKGGEKLIGQLLSNHSSIEAVSKVEMVIEYFKENDDKNRVFCYHDKMSNTDAYLVAIRNTEGRLIGFTGLYEDRTPDTSEPYYLD